MDRYVDGFRCVCDHSFWLIHDRPITWRQYTVERKNGAAKRRQSQRRMARRRKGFSGG